MCPDAHMRASDKGEMRVGRAPDVKTVRVGKHGFVAVDGGKHSDHSLSLADTLSTQLDIDSSATRTTDRDRGIIAQELFDGSRHQLRLGAQGVRHVWMLDQALNDIAEKWRHLRVRASKQESAEAE